MQPVHRHPALQLPSPRRRIALRRPALRPSAMAPGIGRALPHLTETGCLYLDYNATTPVFPEVADEILPFITTHFGNPSSTHAYGAVVGCCC